MHLLIKLYLVLSALIVFNMVQGTCVCADKNMKICQKLGQYSYILKAKLLRMGRTGTDPNIKYIIKVNAVFKGQLRVGAKVALQSSPYESQCFVGRLRSRTEYLFTVGRGAMLTSCGINKPWASLNAKLKRNLLDKKAFPCKKNAKKKGNRFVPIKKLTNIDPLPELTNKEAKELALEASEVAEKLKNLTQSDTIVLNTGEGDDIEIVSLGQLIGFGTQAPTEKQKVCSAIINGGCQGCAQHGCTWQPDGTEGYCTENCDFKDMQCRKNVTECRQRKEDISAVEFLAKQPPLKPPVNTSAEATPELTDKKCFNVTEEGCTHCISVGCTWQPEAGACTLDCAITTMDDCVRKAKNCSVPVAIVAAPPPEQITPEMQCKEFTGCKACMNATIIGGENVCTWQPGASMCTHSCSLEDSVCVTKGQPCPMTIDEASWNNASNINRTTLSAKPT